MSAIIELFRKPEGIRYHGGALTYAVVSYVIGFSLLFSASVLGNLLGTLMLAHGMIIAAYMIHEAAHNTVFRNNAHNARLGECLSWLCGAAYGTYEDMRFKHFRHHVDNDDVVWFDYEAFFAKHPRVLRVVHALEWFYIPAHEFIMHGIMILTSFVIPQRRDQRVRNLKVIFIRGGLYLLLVLLTPKAAFLYAIAYILMMTVLRFMDSIQHDYGFNPTLFSDEVPPRKGDRAWENEHTFSDPHVPRDSILNWFTLNFGWHNAHHAKPTTPWYNLPKVHVELFGDPVDLCVPLKQQLKIFHKYRVIRVIQEGGDLDDQPEIHAQGRDFLEAAKVGKIYGGNAASFLTSF